MNELSCKNRRFVGRLKTNTELDALAAEHIVRPPGGPPTGGYEYAVELGSSKNVDRGLWKNQIVRSKFLFRPLLGNQQFPADLKTS